MNGVAAYLAFATSRLPVQRKVGQLIGATGGDGVSARKPAHRGR